MPLQNRVLPTGDIVAVSARGTLTGNRGIIHQPDRTLGTSRWSHHAWICCALDWQGRKRTVMTGRNWTELFFLDEAVALAAGHRPCGYCRRADYARFRSRWGAAFGTAPKAPQMDRTLHRARVSRDRRQVTHTARMQDLADGCFVWHAGAAYIVIEDSLRRYTPDGYGPPLPRPMGKTTVLTPAPTVAVLAAGYRPALHHSTLAHR